MVSKPCQLTSASPSCLPMHYLDMHISCLEGTWETHVGQSSRSASLNKNKKGREKFYHMNNQPSVVTFENKERCYHFARCSNSQSTCGTFWIGC